MEPKVLNCWGHSPRSWWLVAPIVRWKPGTTPCHRAAQLGRRWDCDHNREIIWNYPLDGWKMSFLLGFPIFRGYVITSGAYTFRSLFEHLCLVERTHWGCFFFEMSVLFLFVTLGKDRFGENWWSFFGRFLGAQARRFQIFVRDMLQGIDLFFVEGVSIDRNYASKNLEEMRKRVC